MNDIEGLKSEFENISECVKARGLYTLVERAIQRARNDPSYILFPTDAGLFAYHQALRSTLITFIYNQLKFQEIDYSGPVEFLTESQEYLSDLRVLTRELPPEVKTRFVQSAVRDSCLLLTWERYGRPVYDVSDTLAWVFLNTEIVDLPITSLVLPYPCLVIKLQHLTTYENKGEMYKPIFVRVYKAHSEVGNFTEVIFILESVDINNYPMWEFVPLGKYIENTENLLIEHTLLVGDNPIFRAIYFYCINVLLYATSKDADDVLRASSIEYLKLERRVKKAKGSAKKRFKEQLAKIPPKYVHFLGSQTIINRRKIVNDDPINDMDSACKRVMRGHFVQGHWHTYWTGEGRQKKILKLLKPFWRGGPPSEEQELETNKYLLK
jgi:hypothetical protein